MIMQILHYGPIKKTKKIQNYIQYCYIKLLFNIRLVWSIIIKYLINKIRNIQNVDSKAPLLHKKSPLWGVTTAKISLLVNVIQVFLFCFATLNTIFTFSSFDRKYYLPITQYSTLHVLKCSFSIDLMKQYCFRNV